MGKRLARHFPIAKNNLGLLGARWNDILMPSGAFEKMRGASSTAPHNIEDLSDPPAPPLESSKTLFRGSGSSRGAE